MRRGEPESALIASPVRVQGECMTGAQDHFYLETHVALAVPEEDGAVHLWSSTQHPSEVQEKVADVLGVGRHHGEGGGAAHGRRLRRQGDAGGGLRGAGGAGGHHHRAARQGMAQPGSGHGAARASATRSGRATTRASTRTGQLLALKVELVSDGGWSNDLSHAILDRALFHLDNAYFLPNVEAVGRVARTNYPSNTAFRGFGGPQGMYVIEEVLNHAAEQLGLDPAEVRRVNLLPRNARGPDALRAGVEHNRMPRIHTELMDSSGYAKPPGGDRAFNASSRWTKRGIGYQPVKFGISFTTSFLNQAGALVVIYADGTVQLNHGGTEMGQGLHTKMRAVCAHELGICRGARAGDEHGDGQGAEHLGDGGLERRGSQRVRGEGGVRHAARAAAARRREAAAGGGSAEGIEFSGGQVFHAARPQQALAFEEVTQAAYLGQVSLSATGYYRTPDIGYDRVTGRGKPFHYFAFGGAVVEVEVSGLTGEHRVRRVDILHDVGSSLVPNIDKGQVEGAFIQGVGWLTCEEVLFNTKGQLLTHSPDTYKIPALGDTPEDFHVALLERAPQENTIHGSKAVGEPPFMLAIGVVTALRHAIGGFGPARTEVQLASPATPEAILRAVEVARNARS